jgi:hypothetical protein
MRNIDDVAIYFKLVQDLTVEGGNPFIKDLSSSFLYEACA